MRVSLLAFLSYTSTGPCTMVHTPGATLVASSFPRFLTLHHTRHLVNYLPFRPLLSPHLHLLFPGVQRRPNPFSRHHEYFTALAPLFVTTGNIRSVTTFASVGNPGLHRLLPNPACPLSPHHVLRARTAVNVRSVLRRGTFATRIIHHQTRTVGGCVYPTIASKNVGWNESWLRVLVHSCCSMNERNIQSQKGYLSTTWV